MKKHSIRYRIDNVVIVDEIIIRGWAFSTNKKEIKYMVNNNEVSAMEIIRDDVSKAYARYSNALYSGFEIRIPLCDEFILTLDDGVTKVVKSIQPGVKNDKILDKLKDIKHTFEHILLSIVRLTRRILHLEKDEQTLLYRKTLYKKNELDKQRNTTFDHEPKVSIIVPLFNTSEVFLRDMIQSVLSQTYKKWELCLCDGSDIEHAYVERVCHSYDDGRIVYKHLKTNLGIVGNTNECLKMATGEYLSLLDHDDVLHSAALFEVVSAINKTKADFIYTDEVTFEGKLKNVFNPHFKPDFAIDNLRANNYICHFSVFSHALFDQVGGYRDDYEGSQDHDMVLRLSEKAEKIHHIAKILYYWRSHEGSVASDVSAKPYVIESAKKAIKAHLDRIGLEGEVCNTIAPSIYRINYKIKGNPLVSIMIPNKDHIDDLQKCIDSIKNKSTYTNYEIIIIENNSVEKETFDYYNEIESENIHVVIYKGGFNYSAINNLGFQHTKGEYVLLLNNDVEILTPNWLEEMLMYCQRKDVGIVGAKLLYPDNTIQHAGIGIGILTIAGHYHKNFPKDHPGYMGRMLYAHDVSAVTGACMMVKRSVYEEVNGLDETFEVAFNDVDFCLKVRQKEYLIVITPYAQLYHYESKSRGYDDSPVKQERFRGEIIRFSKKWKSELQKGDPFYNQNLTHEREDFGVNYRN